MSPELFLILEIAVICVGCVGFICYKKFTEEKPYIKELVLKAISVAEVLFEIPKSGEAKKAWVIKYVSPFVSKYLSEQQLSELIDKLVEEINQIKSISIN